MNKHWPSERMRGIERTLIRQIHDKADPSCLDLGLGEPSFPTPASIRNHLKANIDRWHLGYTPNAGLRELRELIAGQCGFAVSADQVCVTIGAEEGIWAALTVTVDPRDEILVPDPGYPAYESLVKIVGGVPKKYPLDGKNGFLLRSEDVGSCISDKTKAVILNSPNNPTGAVYSKKELEKLSNILDEKNVLVISDEVYRELYFGEKPGSVADHARNCVVVNSVSKSFSMTGWRLGWCTAPSKLIESIISFNQLAVICPPVISQHAAIFALKGLADEEKKQNFEEMQRRRALALTCLEKYTPFEYIVPQGAFYIFMDVSDKMPEYGNTLEISLRILAEKKVVTIPGVAFGEKGEGYLRISFAASPEHIVEGIRRIGQFFKAA